MDSCDMFYMINKLIIRAGPEPKNCYICGAGKRECKRYVLPQVYFIRDLYAITGNIELLKNIKVFWLCPEHHTLFDNIDRHWHWRDLGKPLAIDKNPVTGEAVVRFYKNPVASQESPSSQIDVAVLTDSALSRTLEICEKLEHSRDIILSVFDSSLPNIQLLVLTEERGEDNGLESI